MCGWDLGLVSFRRPLEGWGWGWDWLVFVTHGRVGLGLASFWYPWEVGVGVGLASFCHPWEGWGDLGLSWD